jgi:hypothetical protein
VAIYQCKPTVFVEAIQLKHGNKAEVAALLASLVPGHASDILTAVNDKGNFVGLIYFDINTESQRVLRVGQWVLKNTKDEYPVCSIRDDAEFRCKFELKK